jgi:hypothetical protein
VGLDNTVGRDSDNAITEQFGMYFLTDNGGGNYLVTEYTEDHYLNAGNKSAGIRFRGEGVSPVRISPPARMLAPLQDAGLGGRIEVNEIDKPFNPETDAALAIAEVGKGRVLGVFDRNTFWNAGEGTRLSHVDNREFAQRMLLWLAGLEDGPAQPGEPMVESRADSINRPPVVELKARLLQAGSKEIELSAIVKDDGKISSVPEVRWSLANGAGEAVFENNNPNGKQIRVVVDKLGRYTFSAQVDDGEFKVHTSVQIDVE